MELEHNIKTLDQLLEDLVYPELDLNTAVEKYDESLKLAKDTFAALDKIKQRVEVLNATRDQLLEDQMSINTNTPQAIRTQAFLITPFQLLTSI